MIQQKRGAGAWVWYVVIAIVLLIAIVIYILLTQEGEAIVNAALDSVPSPPELPAG